MFKVTRSADDRLDIKMSGKLDSDQMKAALDELVDKSSGIEGGKMLYDVVDYHLPSLGAIGIEFSRLPAMLGFMKRFDRAAVLTDKKWLKVVSEIKGVFYPGLEIKAFSREQKAEAEAWLSSEDG
jgi:hypothetical protein